MSQSRNNKSEDFTVRGPLDHVLASLDSGAELERSQEPRAAKVLPIKHTRSYRELEERVVA